MRGSRGRCPARLARAGPPSPACRPTAADVAVVTTPVVSAGTARATVPAAYVARWVAATVVPVAVAVGVTGRHPDRHTPPPPRVRGGVARSGSHGGPASRREEA